MNLRAALLVVIPALVSACAESGLTESVIRADSAGVEVLTVHELPGLTEPGLRWSTDVVWSLSTAGQDPAGPPLIYLPQDILPISEERLLVVDRHDIPFVLLDLETGKVIRRFGKRGRGPGEAWGPFELAVVDGDLVSILDASNRKILRFNTNGELTDEVMLQPGGMTNEVRLLGDSRFLVTSWERVQGDVELSVNEVRADGELSRFATLPGSSDVDARIQSGRALWVGLRQGVVTMRSDRPLFQVMDTTGQVVREVRLPLTMRELTSGEIERLRAQYGALAARFEPGPIALTNQLYVFSEEIFGMYQSDLWHAQEDGAVPEDSTIWRLFSTDGDYKGAFFKPPNFSPMWFGDGIVWGAILDGEGVPVLEKRVLVPPAGN